MKPTEEQKECFKKLWFIYGNNGSKCTMLNHKLIQGFIEYDEDRRDDYKYARSRLEGEGYNLTMECWEVVNLVMNSEFDKALKIAKAKNNG